ncbi:hypothetical protein BDD12DRAFT_885938 [Trichophaea hybrida]|nr:hypothetical protein BDD12DRAFT_885938 [Trichophaea hybrida]
MIGLEIAAITITVINRMLALGDKTADIIQAAQDFEADPSRLYSRTRNQLNRARTLKELLFTPISIGDGVDDTVFSHFGPETQVEIAMMFEQLEGTLSDVHSLLWGRYEDACSDASSCSTPSTPTRNLSSTFLTLAQDTLPTLSSAQWKLRWAFKDKKRAEQLLVNFNDTNVDIFEHIKLLLISSNIFQNLEYGKWFQENRDARELGLDSDARLRIMAVDEESAMQLELEIPASSIQRIDSTFGTGNQQIVLTRARQLAALLHQAKDPSFRVLKCRGYAHLASENRFAFLYNIPDLTCYESKPISLLDELRNRKSKPSLGDKFRLATVLASSMAQLHMVHKSFRIQKIIFFRRKDNRSQDPIEYDKPWIFGFEYSRPECDFTVGCSNDDIENDIYRHPDCQGQPSRPFSKIHDIYALGVVLLEIRLWQPAIKLEKNRFSTINDQRGIQQQLQKHASRRLKDKVGEKYTKIVEKCLAGDFIVAQDTKDDLKLQRLFRETVISVLEKAAQSI